jgi:ATP-binding cassette subfamily E protein 1
MAKEEDAAALSKAMSRIVVLDHEKCKPNTPAFDYLRKWSKPCAKFANGCIQTHDSKIRIREDACPACLHVAKRCPSDAVRIVNVPHTLSPSVTFRYGWNGFKLHRLPAPRPDQVLGLVGTNGIGKSTALQILAGNILPNLGHVDQPSWGEVQAQFRGSELQTYFARLIDEPARAMATVMKPQRVEVLAKHLQGWTVRALLEQKAASADVREAVVSALELLPLAERNVGVLSGGELQRLALALVLVQQADVYLIDEPSSYLDVVQRLRAARAIRDAKGPNTYMVVVEHDLAVLDYLSDATCLFYGERAAYGVASASLAPRDGINAFLAGFLPTENVRFRKDALRFNSSSERVMGAIDPDDPWAAVRYPDLVKTVGNFRLHVEGGRIEPGQIVVLLGQNGMGKTLLVKILAGRLLPDADEGGKTPDLPALRISYKPQMLAPRFQCSVRELLHHQIGSTLSNPNFSQEILEPLHIEPLLDSPVEQLSGGEIQRVALAGALGRPADVYLIDEPSAYLDSEQRIAVARVLKRFVQASGKSAIVVEHDFMMATYVADAVIVYEGMPSLHATARAPQRLQPGMNSFLRSIDVTFRRDPETLRPRVNKPNSALDKEQKASGYYFFMEERYSEK